MEKNLPTALSRKCSSSLQTANPTNKSDAWPEQPRPAIERHQSLIPAKLSPNLRWACFASGIALLSLLAVARYLTPSPSGQGTHQQLGLPACTTMVLWDLPCPACGMTTSWAWAARGQFILAAQANSGGLLLAIIAMAYLPASCYFSLHGMATRGQWFSSVLATSLVTAIAVTVLHWLLKIWP
jgi:hypothetical protein